MTLCVFFIITRRKHQIPTLQSLHKKEKIIQEKDPGELNLQLDYFWPFYTS